MEWLSENSPPGSKVITLSNAGRWHTDVVSEWFPTITRRTSVATVQGFEWMPELQYYDKIAAYEDLIVCYQRDERCLSEWAKEHRTEFTHVYVSSSYSPTSFANDHTPLSRAIQESSSYERIYRNESVTIYERK